jgi:phosphoserine phosphatase
MRGEINFKESFHKRIALLKGMPENVLQVTHTKPYIPKPEPEPRTLNPKP